MSSNRPKQRKKLLIFCSLILYFSHCVGHSKLILAPPTLKETLKDAADEAIANNPSLLSAEDTVQVRKAQVRQAQGGFLPTVDASYGYGIERSDNSTTRSAGYSWRTMARRAASLTASQLVYDAGEVYNQFREAKANARVAFQDYLDTRQSLLLGVVRSYTDILRLKETMKVNEETLHVFQDVLNKTQKNYQAGVGQLPEVTLAKSRVYQTLIDIKQLRAQQEIAESNFIRIVGSKPHNLAPVEAPKHKIPKTLTQAIEIGLRNNPTLRSTELAVRSAQFAANVAKTNFYPKFDVNFSANRNLNVDGSPGSNKDQQITVNMDYNIFNGGSDYANLKASKMRLQQAIHDYEDTKRIIIDNIRSAWENYNSILKRIPNAKANVKEETFTAKAYDKQYVVGRRTLIDLVTVERGRSNAEVRLVNERYDLIVSAYTLLAAMGEIEGENI